MNPQASAVINALWTDSRLLPLSSFKSTKFSKYNLFPHASNLPPFFDHNLQSEARVVKHLRGPHGAFRAFYYQLLKLGFEVDTPTDYGSIIKNVIFDPELSAFSASPTSGREYNFSQYQRILAQFIRVVQTQVIPNVELTFSQYPVIDEAMLAILELIVEKSQVDPDRKIENLTELFERLCEIFCIGLEVYDNCFSFEESDVFVYVESSESFYMAFLSEMAEVESIEKTSESQLDLIQTQQKQQQFSSISYAEGNQQEVPVYRDIRLSAGNKNTVPRMVSLGRNAQQAYQHPEASLGGSPGRYSQENQSERGSQSYVRSQEQQPATQYIHEGGGNVQGEGALPKNVFTTDHRIESQAQGIKANMVKEETLHRIGRASRPSREESRASAKKMQSQSQSHLQIHRIPQPNTRKAEDVNKMEKTLNNNEVKAPQIRSSVLLSKLKTLQSVSDIDGDLGTAVVNEENNVNIRKTQEYLYGSGPRVSLKINNDTYQYQFKSLQPVLHPSIGLPQTQPHRVDASSPPQNLINSRQSLNPKATQFESFYNPKYQGSDAPWRSSIEDAKINIYAKSTHKANEIRLRQPDAVKGDNTLGTFYREFSDTRVMEAMAEPYKSRVRATRQRFRGVRSKNFRGFK